MNVTTSFCENRIFTSINQVFFMQRNYNIMRGFGRSYVKSMQIGRSCTYRADASIKKLVIQTHIRS